MSTEEYKPPKHLEAFKKNLYEIKDITEKAEKIVSDILVSEWPAGTIYCEAVLETALALLKYEKTLWWNSMVAESGGKQR